MNYRTFLLMGIALAGAGSGAGEINAAKPPRPQGSAPEHVSLAWVKAGRVLVYNAQGIESLPPTTFVYVGPGQTGRLALDGNPEHIVWVVRSEYGTAVPFEFVAGNIVKLLTGFGTCERPIARSEIVELFETAEASLQNDPVERKKFDELLVVPSVTARGKDGWGARYFTLSGNAQIVWCVAEGTIAPFGVTRFSRYTLTANSAERLTPALLAEAIAAKERAQNAETAIAEKTQKIQ